MYSTSSAALVDSASDSKELGCEQSRSARLMSIADQCSNDTGHTSAATTTCETSRRSDSLLISGIGLILSAEDSPASHSALLQEEIKQPLISGQRWIESSPTSGHASLSLKTSLKRRSPTRAAISPSEATARTTAVYLQMMRGLTIREIVGGSLHTPTVKANFIATSMQKWPSCRRYVDAFGGQRITARQFEFLMGYPPGWTETPSKPSATPSSRKSRKSSAAQSCVPQAE
jgi:hypothetical protein